MLKMALPTCLQSVAPVKIKAADLKPTDKSEVCSRRSRHWTLGPEKGVRPALPDGAALHGARPKGWIDKFPAYAKLKRDRETQDARDGKPRHQARRGRHAIDDDGEFPYRGRPGCACCGDQKPVLLRRTEDCYSSMTGPPDRDSFRNIQVCMLCVVDNPEFDEMFPVGRIYRTATKEDMLKLASKFGAETACMQKRTA